MSDLPSDLSGPVEHYLRWNLGYVLSGLGITGAMVGFSSAQMVFYVRRYWNRDQRTLRTIVLCVWGLDLLHLAMYAYTMYHFAVANHADFLGQAKFPWSSFGQNLVNSFLIALVQTFYLMRVWALSTTIAVTAGLASLVATAWAMGVVITGKLIKAGDVSDAVAFKPLLIALSSLVAVTDISITITLVWLLLRASGSDGYRSQRLKYLVNRLMFYTINTGLLTSVLALLSLIAIMVTPTTNIYVLMYYLSVRLYTISMLASLNAREGLRHHMGGITSIGAIDIPDMSIAPTSETANSNGTASTKSPGDGGDKDGGGDGTTPQCQVPLVSTPP